MGLTQELLDQVSNATAAQDEPLKEARARLALVRKIAEGFEGSLRSYQSGSLAHHTVVDPVSDGDGGLVLDRVKFPTLGPEGKRKSSRRSHLKALHRSRTRNQKDLPKCKVWDFKEGTKDHLRESP